mgnify:CR=1 FL=1
MSAILYHRDAFPVLDGWAVCAAANGYLVADGDDLDLPAARMRCHKNRGSVVLTDCRGAGKRGARLAEISVEADGYGPDGEAKRHAAMAWLAALPLAEDFSEAARWAAAMGLSTCCRELRGVDVRPVDLPELVLVGPRVAVSLDHRQASASDLTDRHNEPRALTRNPSIHAAKKARAALEFARPDIESGAIGFSGVLDLLSDAGFSMHSWCAMD